MQNEKKNQKNSPERSAYYRFLKKERERWSFERARALVFGGARQAWFYKFSPRGVRNKQPGQVRCLKKKNVPM
jgi:hypothetical protein